ncbi:unnamed protein product [Fusarium venenatum]|uniref:Zn(2)-C6 fungal-type domain-containing protein n=1 Tax=Fusarium venenatum TaxID=56646 RepID=A0A2L2SPH8_9HYPO|nr:uncharacterized protein FVRRES_11092 [Fusarium venenatum]CEI38401.1 unnamed protein product [Fusarium venenatum]
MVNLGRPAMGCFNCKDSRVKCDLKKPSCGRCKRLTHICPGYPDTWSLIHRQQNEKVSRKVQLRVNRQQRLRQNNTDTPPLSASAIHASPVSVPRYIDQNVQIDAVHRMYYDLCFDASVGVFVALPFIAVKTSVSPFMHALQAAALAHSSANLNQYGLLPKLEYCAAISALKRDIADPARLQNDAILMSIFLLGLFEVIVQQRSERKVETDGLKCHPHATGALALIRYRTQQKLDSSMDISVFQFYRHVRSQTLADVDIFRLLPGAATRYFPPRHRPELTGGRLSNVATLFDEIIQTIADLGHVASLVAQCPRSASHPGYFNGLLSPDNETSVAIAKSLYLTMRLHMTEMLLSLLEDVGAPVESVLKATVVDELCEIIRMVIDGNLKCAQGGPGMTARLLLMSWPMLAVLQSHLPSLETKAWVQSLLDRRR